MPLSNLAPAGRSCREPRCGSRAGRTVSLQAALKNSHPFTSTIFSGTCRHDSSHCQSTVAETVAGGCRIRLARSLVSLGRVRTNLGTIPIVGVSPTARWDHPCRLVGPSKCKAPGPTQERIGEMLPLQVAVWAALSGNHLPPRRRCLPRSCTTFACTTLASAPVTAVKCPQK